jgi:hypothetical protein
MSGDLDRAGMREWVPKLCKDEANAVALSIWPRMA